MSVSCESDESTVELIRVLFACKFVYPMISFFHLQIIGYVKRALFLQAQVAHQIPYITCL